jgi:16S rRNA (guanine527-N7)-methyltransferase
MQNKEIINILQQKLNFTAESINTIKLFIEELLEANKRHNFISRNSESSIWQRHILDSAQLTKFIDFKKGSLSDLGSGAGFPGLVLAIFNRNKNFHVKLYEKSPVKRAFLKQMITKLSINAYVYGNIFDEKIESDYIVSRAFKKFEMVIQVSREIAEKPHKLIVLKGQNAQQDLKKAFIKEKYDYKLENSMTDKDSNIVIINFKK